MPGIAWFQPMPQKPAFAIATTCRRHADAGPGCEKNGRRATWAVTTRSGRHQVPVAVLPTAKSLSAFSLKPQSDRLLEVGHTDSATNMQVIGLTHRPTGFQWTPVVLCEHERRKGNRTAKTL